MEAPEPTDDIEIGSWGVFFALDADRMFWFQRPDELLAFLYLGAGRYLSFESSKRQALATELRQQWSGVERMLCTGATPARYFDELELKLRRVDPILWYGQFGELLESDEPFPAALRELFFRSSGFVTFPKKRELQVDHFEEWLLELHGNEEFCVNKSDPHLDLRLPTAPRAGHRNEGGVWVRND